MTGSLDAVSSSILSGLPARISELGGHVITVSAFAVHARTAVSDKDVLRFSVSQPLRVEDGRASLTLPVARTRYGAIQHASFTPDLAPDERQIDVFATTGTIVR